LINLLASTGTTILSIILAILLLLVMITVHEFGHYIVGTAFHFKINEFAIGFGPAIFKRRKKNGQLFSVRVFPLGGYCAFEGEDGEELEEPTDEEQLKDASKADGQADELVVTDEKSREVAENVEQLEVTRVEAEVTQQAVEGTTEGVEARKPHSDPNAFTNKPPWQRILVLLAGATMNYLLGLIIIMISFLSFGQMAYKINSVEVNEQYSTEYSLADGDILLAVEGRTVYMITDGMKAINGKVAGDSATLTVLRDGTEQDVEIVIRSDCDFDNISQTSKFWRALGVGTYAGDDGALYWDLGVVNNRLGFFKAIGCSFAYSFRIAGTIFTTLGQLLTGHLSISAVGGPITTITTTAKVALQGVQSFLEIAAYIGVNLAVFNLLPIPALDGSKIVFCLIEWVAKRPVPRKIEAVIHAVGFVLILGFAILVDVLQFI
jgi:regulator of sigma E protease